MSNIKFGDVLDTVFVGPNDDVPVHIHCNDSRDDDEHQYHAWNHESADVDYGLKWECVEFARRYLHLATRTSCIPYVLPFVDNAKDLWTALPRESRRGVHEVALLKKHAVLIFDDRGAYEGTGHVAIAVSEPIGSTVEIAEQNMDQTRRIVDVSNEKELLGWFDLLPS